MVHGGRRACFPGGSRKEFRCFKVDGFEDPENVEMNPGRDACCFLIQWASCDLAPRETDTSPDHSCWLFSAKLFGDVRGGVLGGPSVGAPFNHHPHIDSTPQRVGKFPWCSPKFLEQRWIDP
jgi:hypothetical protein